MATLTINTTAAHAARVVAAFGLQQNLGRDATAAEVKQQVIEFMKGVVFDQEDRVTKDAVVTPLITPT